MAINFPDTAGQATDGTFTYTVAGITYAWNGSSWAAAGAGASATNRSLFSVTTNSASGGGSLSYDTSSGGFTYTPPDLSGFLSGEADTLATVTARGATTNDTVVFGDGSNAGEFRLSLSGGNYLKVFGSGGETYIRNDDNDIGNTASTINIQGRTGVALWQSTGNLGLQVDSNCAVKLYYSSAQKLETTTTGVTITGALTAGGLTYPTTNGSSGQVLTSDGSGNVTWTNGGLQSRTTSASGLNTLANSASATPNITSPKTYALLGIETTHAAWVVLYNSDAARTADQSRNINVDPVAGSGVLAEVITTGAQTQYLSPGVICYNTQTTGTTYARVTNLSGSTASVNVTLTYVQLEA